MAWAHSFRTHGVRLTLALPNPYRGLRGLPAEVWIIAATTFVNRAGMMAVPLLNVPVHGA